MTVNIDLYPSSLNNQYKIWFSQAKKEEIQLSLVDLKGKTIDTLKIAGLTLVYIHWH